MGYFDDPKNKREWDAELAKLTAEREGRGKTPGSVDSPDLEKEPLEFDIEPELADALEPAPADFGVYAENPFRTEITYEQLLQEAEKPMSKTVQPKNGPQIGLQKEKETPTRGM
jgi:hypothetical protein